MPDNPDLPLWVDRESVVSSGIFYDRVAECTLPRLLLLSDANDRMLDSQPVADQIRAYHRLLFQAAVLKAIDDENLDADWARQRMAALGESAVREIRYVLEADHFIHPNANELAAYRMFAMVYLDLRTFEPRAVRDFFPSVRDGVDLTHLNPDKLYRRTRPEGVPDAAKESWNTTGLSAAAQPGSPSDAGLAHAERTAKSGNHVRAAILYSRWPSCAEQAHEQIRILSRRVGETVGWSETECREWADALFPLLAHTNRGNWSRAARCLYELQKIPTDLRGEVFAVDVIEWIRSLGRRRIVRPLSRTRHVILLRHLRAAEKQLLHTRLKADDKHQISHLLHREMHRAESHLRTELMPVVIQALNDSGLRPESTVETISLNKLAAELIDRVCERGYLRVGDLRDAIARNQVKMPDLAGIGEWLRGDALLKADTRLVYDLDGIYRRGEFYLRLMQRFSSLFFGTPWGRLLTLYLLIPFGGAFLTLMAAEELRHIGGKLVGFVSTILTPHPKPTAEAVDVVRDAVSSSAHHAGKSHGSFLIEPPTVVAFGLFLMLMIHVPPFRRAVFAVLKFLWGVLRFLLHDLPLAVWRSPPVVYLRRNPVSRWIRRYLGVPIVLTAIFDAVLAILGADLYLLLRSGLLFLLGTALFVNSRIGWLVQDRTSERISDTWRRVRVNLIPGIIGGILAAFRALANWIEQRLYAVDESLRFRSGDSRLSLVLKAGLGLIWFPFAYVTRFVFYLLVEPQVNPVKHFPVVTVSHKVLWPMVPQLAELTGLSPLTVGMVANCIPGIFGFMAWELKENWRLYQANRPQTLRPATIGSHGETMRGLLRPGFHSGTVPKGYKKLRRAWCAGRPDKVSRSHHEIEHVAEAVYSFVEREMIDLLRTRPEWRGEAFEVKVRCGCRRFVILIEFGEGKSSPLAFVDRDGLIAANFENEQDLKTLDDERQGSLRDAATGLFQLGAASGEPAWTWADWVRRWQ